MSRLFFLVSLFAAFIVITAFPAHAQEASASAPVESRPAAGDVSPEDAKEADAQARLELARKMHEIWPASAQIEQAINKIAMQVPESDRQQFKDSMLKAIDGQKLEQVSINAMAEIFTTDELQAMVAYYSSPEAKSVSEKMPIYNSLIQPEVVKMLDKAMLDLRTGAASR